ncbi:hypothetical protein Dimus_021942 [Dionaea muscipula]
MVEKAVERVVDRVVEREFHTLFDKLRDAINTPAKENDIQFDVKEPVHQVEEQDVDGNVQEPLHQSESRQAAKDTDVAAKDTDLAAATSVAAKDTDVAAALLLTDLTTATSIGTTTAMSVGNTELLAAMSVAAKDTDVSATWYRRLTCRPLRMIVPEMGRISRYIGTLANADAKFFSDFTREDFQLEEIHIDAWMVYLTKKIMKKGNPEYALVGSYLFIYIENLWKNWDPDSEPDPDQPSKIPEELTNYVWGLNPEWGIEWWNVRHVLAHINLEELTIEIYDSLVHKTPKNPGHRLASFEGMRTLLPLILDEAGYFKRGGRRRRSDPFKSLRIPPKKVPKHEDANNCGIWTLYFAERIVLGMAINVNLEHKYITGLRKHNALQIFANSDLIEEVEQ